jgi:hypothetical protein
MMSVVPGWQPMLRPLRPAPDVDRYRRRGLPDNPDRVEAGWSGSDPAGRRARIRAPRPAVRCGKVSQLRKDLATDPGAAPAVVGRPTGTLVPMPS